MVVVFAVLFIIMVHIIRKCKSEPDFRLERPPQCHQDTRVIFGFGFFSGEFILRHFSSMAAHRHPALSHPTSNTLSGESELLISKNSNQISRNH